MATRFPVPKSPSRSIFQIENFLGVDLTNSGTNIDEIRSPNAVNMVRHVPGKVRKRMGYETRVSFGLGTNVNRALGTSNGYAEFELSDEETLLYKLADTMSSCIIIFDYIAENDFTVCGNTVSASEDGHANFGYEDVDNPIDSITAIGDGNVLIKNFSVVYNYDSGTYEWEIAPEDDEKEFVYSDQESNRLNGVHVMALDDSYVDKNPCGINRAKNTLHYYQYYEGDTSFELYDRIPCGVRICVQFEYIGMQGEYSVKAGSLEEPITEVKGTFSHEFVIADGDTIDKIELVNGTSIQIQKLVVAYVEQGQPVEWKPAPEEDGYEFDLNNVYTESDKNYSKISVSKISTDYRQPKGYTYDHTITVGSNDFDGTIANLILNIKSFKIWENLSTSYYRQSNEVANVTIVAVTHNGLRNTVEVDAKCDSNHYVSFILGLNEGDYIETVEFHFNWSQYKTSKLTGEITDVVINKLEPKDIYFLSTDYKLYHVGQRMYMKKGNQKIEMISSSMNNARSMSWQLGEKLYIVDGERLTMFDPYDEYYFGSVSDKTKPPLVSIANAYNGGGVSLDAFNLMSPGFQASFIADGTHATFQLPLNDLDEREVVAYEVVDGEEIYKTEGTDFTVDRRLGTVTFTTAPHDGRRMGEDNVYITAYKTMKGYSDRINKCRFGVLYGMNGNSDRLLLSGNPKHRSWDFLSEAYDGTYFPDTGYASVGDETSAIVGYSRVNNFLATHKDNREKFQNIIVRECTTVNREIYLPREEGSSLAVEDTQLRMSNVLAGEGAVGTYTFNSLDTEPIFLTRSGLFAITAQDLTGEKYGQNRSFYLNGQLLNEENLENAYSTVFNDMYILAVNSKLYILDGLQPTRTDRADPYSSRQYVGFLCDNVPASIIWRDDDRLWFGTEDGQLCRFHNDVDDAYSYNDNGKPIYCCWETPDLDGKLFYKNKTFRYFAIRMMKAIRTSCKLYAAKRGVWSFIKEDASSGVVFDFNRLDFRQFSFSTDNSDKVVHTKIRVKKVDKARFMVENDKLNEPFGLYNLALEYIESGNYKG